jgi:hypothetical protein
MKLILHLNFFLNLGKRVTVLFNDCSKIITTESTKNTNIVENSNFGQLAIISWKNLEMKTRICIFACLIITLFFGCHKEKEPDFASEGKITGPDARMCPSPCCSGWFIEIDRSTYEFDSIPSKSNINLQKETFPVYVKLDWQFSDKIVCPIKRIIIQRIIKVEHDN